jgi:hypothetical protein
MNKKLLIVVAAAILVVGGGATWAIASQVDQSDESSGRIVDSANITAAPTDASTDTPDATSDSTNAPDAPPLPDPEQTTGFGAGDQGTDDSVEGVTDLSAWNTTADAAVLAYLTWDTAESADTRAARLAPHFEPGAPELTSIPKPAGEEQFDYVDFTSTVTVTDMTYTGLNSLSEDQTTMEIAVMVNYTAAFRSALTPRDDLNRATFLVTMSTSDPNKIISLRQR